MKDKLEDMLGQEEEHENPEEALPGGSEENPLEKMDQISKAKPQKKDKGSKKLDEDVVNEMLKTGENTDGMFSPDSEEEPEEVDEKAKVSVGKNVKPSEKYEENFKDDMLKHPHDYKVMTPRGEMTIAEAIRAGYDPMTKSFDENHGTDRIKDKYMSRLNDSDRAAFEQMMDPSAANIAPADASLYGLQENSPMVRQPMQQPEQAQMAMPQQQAPVASATAEGIGAALPGSKESMAPGATDLSALLGGGQ